MPQAWPLTGRIEEIRLVDRLVRRGAPGVVLAGAAGVGKTRLAREVLAAAARRGAVTRWGVGSSSASGLPLGAFAGVVGAVGPEPTRIVARAADALTAASGPGGVVVGVDDAHHLDELSALVVARIAARGTATLVLTLRTGEPAPDVVTALWKDGLVRRLELQPLSGPETVELLDAVLGGPVDRATARRLWTVTAGNALYLRQLVDGECEAGRLASTDGIWRWIGEPRLPPGLVELVEERMGALSGTVRDVVELLAFAEPLGVPVLAGLTGAAAVEEAEARGLVVVTRDGRRLDAALAHPLYGEVRRARCGQLRARRLRGRIAAALAATGARRAGDTLRRGVLAVDSDLAADPALLTAAAAAALDLFDLPLARRLAQAAVEAGAGLGTRVLLGYALGWGGPGADAEAVLAAAADLARTDTEHAQVAMPRVGGLFFPLAQPGRADAVLQAALDTVSERGPRTELLGIGAVVDMFRARPDRAAATAEELLGDPAATPAAITNAGWALVGVRGGQGRLDGLDDTVHRAYDGARAFPSAHIRSGIASMWVRALVLAGRFDDADAAVREYIGAQSDLPGAGGHLGAGLQGCVSAHRGSARTAARLLREEVARLRVANPGALAAALIQLVAPVAMTGDAAAARAALWDAESNRHPGYAFAEPELRLARAWVAAVEGSVREAVAHTRESAALAAAQGQPADEVAALHTAVRLGDRSVAGRLAELARIVDGPLAPAAAAHASAWRAGDGAALLVVAERFADLGARLVAADVAAQAAGLYAVHGRQGSAAAARAAHLAPEGVWTPALAAMATPPGLTAREREITALAAGGASNRQIADRLSVSVRTVEGHLYRACAKLGVGDRSALSSVLPTPGPSAGG